REMERAPAATPTAGARAARSRGGVTDRARGGGPHAQVKEMRTLWVTDVHDVIFSRPSPRARRSHRRSCARRLRLLRSAFRRTTGFALPRSARAFAASRTCA